MTEKDNIEKFLEKNLNIQERLLVFLDNEENIEENFNNFNQLFEDTKIRDCSHELRIFIHMLVTISNDHHRGPNFFSKIKRIIALIKDELKKYTNRQIFSLFKSNKRLLLILIEEGIMYVDEYFVKQIIEEKYVKMKYPQYFQPEIQPFLNEKWFPKFDPERTFANEIIWIEEVTNKTPDNFNEFRHEGENERYLCKIIRDDLIKEFILYVSENNINYNATIDPSIYETNSFLVKQQIKSITLIEYAAFFGSLKVFNFLRNKGVNITPSLWLYAIHGANSELIHIIEGSGIKPIITVFVHYNREVESFKGCIKESLKCHHNDIANYFLNNHVQDEDDCSNHAITQSLRYYNFAFLKNEFINEKSFVHLCHYDYYFLVNLLLTSRDIDINSTEIKIKF